MFLIHTTYRYVVLDSIDQVEEGVVVMVLNTLLDLQLARFRQFWQDILLCSIPQVPSFRTVKILRKQIFPFFFGLTKLTLSLTSSGMDVYKYPRSILNISGSMSVIGISPS